MLLQVGWDYLGRHVLVQLQSDGAGLQLFEGLTGLDLQDASSTWLAVEAGCQLRLSLEHQCVASTRGLGLSQYGGQAPSGSNPRMRVPGRSCRASYSVF